MIFSQMCLVEPNHTIYGQTYYVSTDYTQTLTKNTMIHGQQVSIEFWPTHVHDLTYSHPTLYP